MCGLDPDALTEMPGPGALCKPRAVALFHLALPLQTFLCSISQWVSRVLGIRRFRPKGWAEAGALLSPSLLGLPLPRKILSTIVRLRLPCLVVKDRRDRGFPASLSQVLISSFFKKIMQPFL